MVVDGHKWFSSRADGADFAVVFAITSPDAEPHRRGTSTHCEVRFTGVRGPVVNTLGGEREAFRLAQKRLGPGRILHVMRWLGQMQHAFELMCRYANEREAFGGPLADKQTVQNWVADSAAEIQACRLLTVDAARKIGEGSEARVEISLVKFHASSGARRRDRPGDPGQRGAWADRRDTARRHGAPGAGAWIYDGPDEVRRMVLARRILRSFRDGGEWTFS